MDIQKMRYFIAAAEKGSFTQAANMHYISQTAISQQIASMERELNIMLFDRKGYRIKLTVAGNVFLDDCREIVRKYDSAVSRVRNFAQGVQGELHIGMSGLGEGNSMVKIFQTFQDEYPGIHLVFVADTITGLIDQLEAGSLDIILGFSYDFNVQKSICRETILVDEIGMVVSRKHPLAEKARIPAGDVAGEKIIMISREFGQHNYDLVMDYCRKDGYEPNIALTVNSLDMLLFHVALNHGVGLIPKRVMHSYHHMVHFISLTGTHNTNVFEIAWRRDTANPAVNIFAKQIRKWNRETESSEEIIE